MPSGRDPGLVTGVTELLQGNGADPSMSSILPAIPRPRSFLVAAVGLDVLYAGATGVITGLLPNLVFTRIVGPTTWSYIFWLASAVPCETSGPVSFRGPTLRSLAGRATMSISWIRWPSNSNEKTAWSRPYA